ncbi:MAG: diacylglycerol kinase family protein [Bacteroidota bacterium]
MKKRIASFQFAINGIKLLFKSGINFNIQFVITLITLFAGWYYEITKTEWVVILLCIGCVLVAEAFNTAIEKMVDHLAPEKNIYAGEIKDIAAGAVLLFSIITAFIGIIIFLPYLTN